VPSITHDLALTPTAQWLRRERGAKRSAWDDRERCFDALSDILVSHRASRLKVRHSQPPVSPPHLLKDIAERANFAPEAVYQRWRAEQTNHAIRRWAGPDQSIRPREAFVAEAKIVSFWPYREGALDVADALEMSLIELAAAYLRALGAWATDNLLLAACVPAGPPLCVREDMRVLARRRATRVPAGRSDLDLLASGLGTLADRLVTAVLDDASLTPLGAFNMVRDETLRLLSEQPDPVAVRVNNAVSELADRLLHRQAGEQVISVEQIRKLEAAMADLSALLLSAAGRPPGESGRDSDKEADT
jgi:hypothetical protein